MLKLLIILIMLAPIPQKIPLPHNWQPRDYQKMFFRSFPKIYIPDQQYYDPNIHGYNDYATFVKRAENKNLTRYNYAYIDKTRRYGFDLEAENICIKESQRRIGNYYHVFPTLTQGRRDLWDGKTKHGIPFLDYIPPELIANKRQDLMQIKFRNNSIYQIVGAEDEDTLRGAGTIGYVFSEFAFQNPSGFGVIQPVVLENEGWVLVGTTPQGQNHAYDLRNIAKDSDEWYYECTTCEDAKYIDEEGKLQYAIPLEKIAALKTQSETEKQREYWCNYQTAVEGAVWEHELHELRKDKRITGISPQSMLPVYVAFDIGWTDATAMWFVQLVHNQFHFVDYYENNRRKIPHYIKIMNDWNSSKEMKIKLLLPHDAKGQRINANSVYYDFKEAGFDCEIIPAPKSDYAGVEAVRQVLGRCFFDERNCKNGISAISSYHYEKNVKRSTAERAHYSDKPLHDWSSHGSKALQTFALWVKLMNPDKPPKGDIVNFDGYTTQAPETMSDESKDKWLHG